MVTHQKEGCRDTELLDSITGLLMPAYDCFWEDSNTSVPPHQSLTVSPCLIQAPRFLIGRGGSWSLSLLCSLLHRLRIKATFLFPPSSVSIFFYSALVDRESQDFGQQHLYVIFKWPPHILLSIIVNNSAGGFLSLHTISSIYSLRCLEVANLMNVSAYLIGLSICISLVIMKRKN